jgi:Icc-related predicted phosphoesterase
MFGALGDLHGAFDSARAIVARHPEVPFWLCVGDLATDPSTWRGAGAGGYESVGAPVYWIHGNNDNFDAIASGDLPADLIHIPNGTMVEIAGPEGPAPRVRVAGLGGTFAPTWYETPAADLPSPVAKGLRTPGRARVRDDKRRHFVREEVEACKLLRGVDVFMTHEAAKPFRPFAGGRPSTGLRAGGPDAGKQQVNDVLAAMQPRLHLFGHHHRFSDQVREGVRSVGLDLVTRGYLLIDVTTLEIDVRA